MATYSQIAKELAAHDARKVGWALAGNKDPKVSCHRVIDKDGKVAQELWEIIVWRRRVGSAAH